MRPVNAVARLHLISESPAEFTAHVKLIKHKNDFLLLGLLWQSISRIPAMQLKGSTFESVPSHCVVTMGKLYATDFLYTYIQSHSNRKIHI